MPRTEPSATMRVDRHFTERVLLRTGVGERGEPRLDASVGRVTSGTSRVWKPATDGGVAPRGPGDQSQTSGAFIAVDGSGSDLSQAQPEPTGRGASDLSVSLRRAGNQRSGPSLVQR